jgi:hypothetical protein
MATPFPFWPSELSDEQIVDALVTWKFKERKDLFDEPTLYVLKNLLKDKPEERWRLDRLNATP